MKRLSYTLAALCVLLAAVFCSGCLGDTNSSSEETLTIVTSATIKPFEYYDDKNQMVGIDIELGKEIAKELGMTPVFVDTKFYKIAEQLNSGEADMSLSMITVTDERNESLDFSIPYASSHQVVIVKKEFADTPLMTKEELEEKNIHLGVEKGTTSETLLEEYLGSSDRIEKYYNLANAIPELNSGNISGIVCDSMPGKMLCSQYSGLGIIDTEFGYEEYAAAFKKGNTELRDKVNAALEKLIKNGTVDKIIKSYSPMFKVVFIVS